jgi:CP family cyanate transporter-like MFS transporter
MSRARPSRPAAALDAPEPRRAARLTRAGTARAPSVHPLVLGLALVLVAVNLRPTLTSLPPLLADIERELGLSGATAGLLTALPVLCMALAAPASHRVAHRHGREATVLGATVLIAIGDGLRLAGASLPALFAGTLLAGLGIAACGVVLPGIVKEFFPGREGAASAAYIVAIMLGASLGAAVAVPLEEILGSWQASLATWALPACVAVAVWRAVTARLNEREPEADAHPGRLPWRARSAWLLAAFLSAQSALAYAYIGWLSPAYEARGWSAATAGLLLGALHLAQLVSALVLPVLADRSTDRRPPLVIAMAATVVAAVWLWALPDTLPWAATALLGLGLGGGFALGLVLIVDYAADPGAAGRLAAMVFLVCYATAALAPVVIGALRDVTGGFALPFGLLTVVAAIQLALGTRLGPAHRAQVR